MYGKLFESLYTGSMMGAGAMMFAVWPYIIAHMKPNRDRTVFTVELNAKLIAVLIGEKESDIEDIIRKCCEPDERSRTPDKEGRKLIQHGTYLYEVVNGAIYDQIRRDTELREANRQRQKKHYHKSKQPDDAPPIALNSPATETGTTPPELPPNDPPAGTDIKVEKYHPNARATLHILNEASGKRFRETDANLTIISARLVEKDVTPAGVKEMILRQCKKWGGGEFSDYLQPSTLFGKSKFDGYYANREQPIVANGSKPVSTKVGGRF